MIAKNKKAKFDYEFIEKFEAGLILRGTEIKSIRKSKVSFTDTFCFFKKDGLYVKNLYIAPYENASFEIHDPLRDKKLLLSKKELKTLKKALDEKGMSIIPYILYINKRGYAKLEIFLAKGKKNYDKRQSLKDKDMKRDLDRDYKV